VRAPFLNHAFPATRAPLVDYFLRRARVATRSNEALAAYRLARTDQEQLASTPGATIEARRNLADTIGSIGNLLSTIGRLAEAEAEMRAALTNTQKLADDEPDDTAFRSGLAASYYDRGWLFALMGKSADAEAEYRNLLVIASTLSITFGALAGSVLMNRERRVHQGGHDTFVNAPPVSSVVVLQA
jgi:tetratricopeptide (TPR) repeat protein